MSRLLITGSRNHQWTSYDSHALLIAVREILEKTHELPVLVHGGAPLFPEDFYAWRSGPVCPLLFILHRNFRYGEGLFSSLINTAKGPIPWLSTSTM